MTRRFMKGISLVYLIVCAALTLALTAPVLAQGDETIRFDLVPASAGIAACVPNASARVTVFPKSDIRGVDTLEVKAEGLPPNTDFVVFLTEGPFSTGVGAVQYIGDFTTNAAGKGKARVDAIILEAFSFGVG